jgi:hypothetical protein
VKAYYVRRTPRTQQSEGLQPVQQAPGLSLQNCSNFDAGDPAAGAWSFCWVSGDAPPVWGAAAPPDGVEGFDVAGVVCVGVAVVVEVVVVSVVVVFDVLVTVGVFVSPGTVSVGVVGSGSEAFWLLPPHAARNGARAVRAATDSAPRKLMA